MNNRGIVIRTMSVAPFAPTITAAQEKFIQKSWMFACLTRCEHEAARLASSIISRETLLAAYRASHRAAVIAALVRGIPTSTIVAAELYDPLITDAERNARLLAVTNRKVRKQELAGRNA